MEYIRKIRPEGEKYGVCKIIPPDSWDPAFAINTEVRKSFLLRQCNYGRFRRGRKGDYSDAQIANFSCSDSSSRPAVKN